jgi:hypothetical protein
MSGYAAGICCYASSRPTDGSQILQRNIAVLRSGDASLCWHWMPECTLLKVRLDLITIVVDDYDRAIGFFTGILGFDLVEDSPSLTNDDRTGDRRCKRSR